MSGYFDLQINGYAGLDFNSDHVTAEAMRACCQRLRADGVSGILATIITDELDAMTRRVERIVQLRREDALVAEMVRGLHIEGPFISALPGFVGAHPAGAVRPADAEAMRRLIDAADGLLKIVTLAPETDADFRVIRLLRERGVVVSAGHTDASLDQLRGAIDAGLSMFTHLGNGCPLVMARHDNIIQRVLTVSDRLWVSFIADGVHVPGFVLKNLLRAVGTERAVVVTDAMAAAGLGPGEFTLGWRTIRVGEDGAARTPEGYLAGAAVTMPRSADILREQVGLSPAEIERVTVANPRAVASLRPPLPLGEGWGEG